MKWRGQTRYTLIAPHLISFTRNTKLSLIFVGTEHRCAAATQFFRSCKHRSWVITWRRFGTAYWFYLPTPQHKPTGCPETSVTTNLRCLTSQKSEGLNYRTTKAWNFAYWQSYFMEIGDRGGTVVKVPCYKSEGCWFDPSWCHWYFLLT